MGLLRVVFSFPRVTEALKRAYLTRSVIGGYTELVDVVLESGVYTEWVGGALVEAAHVGQDNVVEYILATGVRNINPAHIHRALWHASESGHLGVLDQILRTGIDLTSEVFHEYSPLQPASEVIHRQIVWKLFEAEVDLEVGIGGRSPLVVAAGIGHAGIVKWLLIGVDLNRPDIVQQALLAASSGNHSDTICVLLDAGAYVHAITDNRTPLMAASTEGCLHAVETLLWRGANVNLVAGGRTALEEALSNGHADVADRLVRAGAHESLSS
ncbi:ankyrin repeat-containing domain protein [Dichotomopilus funicola]|uniref:Ankyrin repeat-containing domain protein n=1 Tax=Dichotomopilus funicola TaxID=1934379 RepID=A0AAN6UXE6_9PEZI|nr:ankyrin repeat-containing domain protein [Dichotomopilus funicola]